MAAPSSQPHERACAGSSATSLGRQAFLLAPGPRALGVRPNPRAALGRRVSALNFVAFALAAGDVLQGHVVPLALVAQQSDVGALSVWRRTASCQGGLVKAIAALDCTHPWANC